MQRLFLLLIIVGSILFNLYGIDSDLPYSRMPTEIEVVKFGVKFGTGDFNPHSFVHPPFFSYLLFILYGIIFLLGKVVGAFHGVEEYKKLYFTNPTLFFLSARFLACALAASSVIIFYNLGKIIFRSKESAIMSCAFIAFSPVFIKWSHYATFEIPMLFLSLSGFYFIIGMLRRGILKDYVLAGIFIGLAIATKYNAGLIIAPALLAHFFRTREEKGSSGFFDKRILVFCAVMLAAYLVGNPFSLLDFKAFIAQFIEQSRRMRALDYNFPSWKATSPGWIYIITDILPFALTRPLSILTGFGIIYSVYRRRKEDFLILSLILISYLITANWTLLKPRYYIYIFPFMLLLGARGMVGLLDKVRFSDARYRGYVLSIVTCLFLISPIKEGIKFNSIIASEPVNKKAERWIESNITSGAKIATFTGIPLVPNNQSIARMLREIEANNMGKAVYLRTLSKNQDWFSKTYDIEELPFPWREDYDTGDFDFNRQSSQGVRYFILTEEAEEYEAFSEIYSIQAEYIEMVKKKSVLIKEFRQLRPKIEPGYVSDEEYVQIYERH